MASEFKREHQHAAAVTVIPDMYGYLRKTG